ncbi:MULTISPECIES: hypothetical protein [unclassified Roseateles]|uniref:hypothetical protein n=1 Tax=unclassified Roseateles TaxID=2626991 RepID=UPI0006F775EE|nr:MULTISPECIES: hypothetical protein [unclassified Roseateles]KQW52249.1 hypothetical protein ASC81_06610 [Pelomonas sp. Root405]KRA78483.1 hypothetical protein ASD88_06615 [Pelomonas sp. Root662]
MNRRLICLLALLPLLPALAFAQKSKAAAPPPEAAAEDKTPRDPNKFAALSLLGDNVQLISLSPARGDTVQSGEWTASPAGGLDNAVLQSLNEAVKAAGKDREVKLYTSTTRSLFGDPANLFVDGKLSLPGKLGDAVRLSGAAKLLLVTRSRQEPALAAALPARILATLEGPGFVLDQRPSANIGFDGQPGRAVLAPYVSIRVALVDLSDLKLRREQSLAVASRLPVAGDANPWAATTAEQRVKALEALIEAELPKAVAGLVAP